MYAQAMKPGSYFPFPYEGKRFSTASQQSVSLERESLLDPLKGKLRQCAIIQDRPVSSHDQQFGAPVVGF